MIFSLNFIIYLRFLLSQENNQRMIRAWRSFSHLNSQSKCFYWCWLNEILVLLNLIDSVYFILIYLIDFVDFHWYFEAGRLTVSCQSGGVCCIYTVILAVCTVWLTLAQPPFRTPKILDLDQYNNIQNPCIATVKSHNCIKSLPILSKNKLLHAEIYLLSSIHQFLFFY